ncbi:MAG: putative 2OG-Fe(II) oxygenase [Rudaea sp.]
MTTSSLALIDATQRIDALLQAGDFVAARAGLRALVAEHPDHIEALRLLAGTEQALGDPAAAETLLRRAVALDPSWTPSLAALGELLLARGRHDEAEPLLLRAASKFAQAALVLARHYNDTQRPADALAVVAPYCAGAEAPPDLVAQHVTALNALGRGDEAVAAYRRAAQARPADALATHALAIALGSAAQHREAEQVAARAIAAGRTDASLQHARARSLIALRDFVGAETALREALRQQPRFVDAHDSLARLVWLRTGDAAQATAALDAALQTFPREEALLAAKAAVLQGAGDARGAHACLAPLAASPHASPAVLVRAGLAALEFDPAVAVALAHRALRCWSPGAPASATARSLLAAALLGLGDAAGALAHCDELLASAPDDQYLVALQTTAWRLLGDERYVQRCDYARLVLPTTLDVPSGWSTLAHFLADVKAGLECLHDPDGHPLLFQSLRHGTETTQDLARAQDPAIRALFGAFDAPIRAYLARIGHGSDPLRRRNGGDYRFNGSWSVRLRSSGFHNHHVHPRGWISSACYIDLPADMSAAHRDAGCLTFGEPGVLTTPALPAEHRVRPAAGMLVLFPSYFWHATVPFTSAQTRLTVAFDIVPGGSR